MRAVEVRAVSGRAVVAGFPLLPEPAGRLWGLPPDLVAALQEWARVAATTTSGGHGGAGEVDAVAVSRRGRHLAARLSVRLRAPVDYVDPVSGHRIALRAVTRTPRVPPVPSPADVARRAAEQDAAAGVGPGGGTPWGPGLAVSVVVAGLVLLANVALAAPMIAGLGLLGVLIDVAVVAGLVPALWLNRGVPTWRWAVFGSLAGMGLGVPVLLVAALSG